MPPQTIVDAHVHLWDPGHFRMSWLDGIDVLNRPYGLAEYAAATQGLHVEAMVYLQVEVEPPYALLEAQWVAQLAKQDDRLKAIVAWAPLEYGEQARAFLDALQMEPLVKGIRRIIQFEPNMDFCLQPGFVRGVELLPEYGMSFDICIDHRHLPNTVELVRQCPNTQFMLDHIAKPDIAEGTIDPWREHMKTLASYPNVMCKVSGLVTEANHDSWTDDDLAPFVAHVLEVFGPDRVGVRRRLARRHAGGELRALGRNAGRTDGAPVAGGSAKVVVRQRPTVLSA